ncbi:MAG TPA: phosphatase PAP2 family protein [Caldimonas sp.]|jgi:undecaprenyl-diphosphatase|nr:phosphatase PAP2 family protein [Caldimonas sp.]
MGEASRATSPARAALRRRLLPAAVLVVVAASLFAILAGDVASRAPLTVVDVAIANWLHRHATPPLVTAMLVWTQLHSTVAVGAYAAVATLVLAFERSWQRAALVVVAVGGGLALNALMKLAFQRARPSFDDPLLTLATYSFPSGHVAGSTIFYGLVVAAVFARTTSVRRRVLAVVGALLAVALVAFSRMLLGAHYLSDVLAAFAEGIAWLAISIAALAALWRDAPHASGAEAA